MPNEIYHRSEWGNPKAEGFGDVYFDASATNKLYKHSDNYENSDGTDKILRDIPNKASIVLTPTAYSDGSLNTVIPPYQVLPQELVTNGTFDTDSDWVKETGWTISGGKANKEGAVASNFYQIVFTANKKYRLTFEISNSNDGRLLIYFGGSISEDILNASDGIYTFEHIANQDTLIFRNVNWVGSIDNVSVKEVQEADFDFSRGSSATRVNEQGLIEDVASNIPRIDYTSGQGALLLEPQRTNSVTYSEDFSQTDWNKTNVSVTSNISISPDGNQNASLIYPQSTSSGVSYISDIISGTNSIYTISAFVKASGKNVVWLYISASVNYGVIYFDLSDQSIEVLSGSISTPTGTITDMGNGWYKVTLTIGSSVILSSGSGIGVCDAKGSFSVTKNGTDGISVWGAQLEAGSYATSYIPTEGSTVTRSADVANNSGNADLFNDSEGVLYANIAALVDDNTSRRISISDGSSNPNNLVCVDMSEYTNQIIGRVRTGNSEVAFLTASSQKQTQNNKIAVKYKVNDFALWINGFEFDTDNNGAIPSGLDDISFDRGNGSNDFYGNVKELAVFKEALTDAELESLTSWISFVEMATDLEYTLE